MLRAPTGRASSARRRRGAAWRSAVTFVTAVALALAGPTSVLAQSGTGSVDLNQALENIALAREALDAADAVRPDAYWNADDLAFDLAFETPETIAEWVRTNVAYQPYRGVLRGPDGTLRDGAGNAWDQALLLTRLLMDAGFTAQVVYATLGEDVATELVAQSAMGDVPDVDVEATVDAYLSVDGTFADELANLVEDAAAREGELRTASEETTAWLLDRLAAAEVSLNDGDTVDEAVTDARDYAWVRYRTSPDEAWVQVHPAAPSDATWTADLAPEGTLESEVPPAFQHRFRVQAFIERRSGSDLETAAVMETWERPVANLNAFGLSYVAMPDGFLQEPALTGEEAFEATQFVTPLFNGALAPGGQLFDLLGNTVPPDAAANPAAGLFGEIGSAIGEASGALSGEEDAVALTAHWLEFTFIGPGGEETTERRMIFDRLGAERRASGDGSGDLVPMTDQEVYAALQTEYSFLLAPGRYAEAFVAAWSSSSARVGLDYLEDLYLASAEDATAVAEPGDEVPEVVRTAPLLRALAEFDDPFVLEGGAISFRPSPALLVRSQAYGVETVATDVVRNDRRALVRDGDAIVADPEAVVRAGVWESSIERAALDASGAAVDTPSFFAAVREQGVEVATLREASAIDPAGFALPEASLRAMQRDLDAGYAVVAPRSLPEGFDTASWWRVDPRSGETLGRGADGRGQSALEYIVLVNSIFLGTVGFGMCRAGGGSMGCCIADAATGVAGGMILGALLAGFSAAAIATGGVLFDTYALAAGGFGLSWCLIESNSTPPSTPGPEQVLVRGSVEPAVCTLAPVRALRLGSDAGGSHVANAVGLRSAL